MKLKKKHKKRVETSEHSNKRHGVSFIAMSTWASLRYLCREDCISFRQSLDNDTHCFVCKRQSTNLTYLGLIQRVLHWVPELGIQRDHPTVQEPETIQTGHHWPEVWLQTRTRRGQEQELQTHPVRELRMRPELGHQMRPVPGHQTDLEPEHQRPREPVLRTGLGQEKIHRTDRIHPRGPVLVIQTRILRQTWRCRIRRLCCLGCSPQSGALQRICSRIVTWR